MTIEVHAFNDSDRKLLGTAYERLLAKRETAVEAMKSLVSDQGYLSSVIVDSIISGIMQHLHEVIRVPGDHQAEFDEFGKPGTQPGSPRTYIDNRLDDIDTLVGQLSAGAAHPSPEPEPAQGTDEVRRRAVT